jgi:hypothetical protein
LLLFTAVKQNTNMTITSPGIINHVPSPSELSKGYGKQRLPASFDRVPGYYVEGVRPEKSSDDNLAGILRHMGNELNFGSPEKFPETIENAYSVARNIGDAVIGNVSPEARALLDGTRPYGIVTRTSSDGPASVHEWNREGFSNQPVLNVDVESVFGNATERRQLLANYEALGVQVKPEHASLLHFLKLVSHEAGHLIQFGVGSHMDTANSGGKSGYDHMSSIALKLHPEVATTANHYTSLRVHNERFAEGYSNIVMKEAVRALGYTDDESAKIMRAVGFQEQASETEQYLNEVTPDKTLTDIGKEKGISLYEGDLGYSMPLSLDQVVADLDIVNQFMKGEDLDDDGFKKRYAAKIAPVQEAASVEVAPAKVRRIKRFGASVTARLGRIWHGNKKTAA